MSGVKAAPAKELREMRRLGLGMSAIRDNKDYEDGNLERKKVPLVMTVFLGSRTLTKVGEEVVSGEFCC